MTTATDTDARWFVVFEGHVDEVGGEGDDYGRTPAPDLYEALVGAGYPVNTEGTAYPFVDVMVQGDAVTAYASHPAAECAMGPAGDIFLAWAREHVSD